MLKSQKKQCIESSL